MLKKIAQGAGLIVSALPVVTRDAVGLVGVGLIAYGAWLVAPAAGFITGGVLLVAGATLISMKAS